MKNSYKPWHRLTKAQRIERWEQVLRVLKGLTPKQRENNFDMGSWMDHDPYCGTTGCAAGHCGLDPWFQARGFTMVPFLAVKDPDGDKDCDIWDIKKSEAGNNPEEFFGIGGHKRVFMQDSASYEATLVNIEHLLVDLRYGIET